MLDGWGPGDLAQAQQLVGQQSWRTSRRGGVCSAPDEPSPLHLILSWFICALVKIQFSKSPANLAEPEPPHSLSVHWDIAWALSSIPHRWCLITLGLSSQASCQTSRVRIPLGPSGFLLVISYGPPPDPPLLGYIIHLSMVYSDLNPILL